MAATRSRLNFVFSPQGEEKSVSFLTRVAMARMGVNGLSVITPQTNPELAGMLQEVSQRAGMAVPKSFVWHSAKPMANAVAISGDVPIVAFSESLLGLLNNEELTAVAAHELGHVKNMSHAGKLSVLAGAGGGVAAWVMTRPLKHIERNTRSGLVANTVSLAKDFLIITGAMAGAAHASRSEEYASDRYGAMLMQGDGTPLMSSLQKLESHNAKNLRPSTFGKIMEGYGKLMRSHPTLEQRSDALGVRMEDIVAYQAVSGPAAVPQQTMPEQNVAGQYLGDPSQAQAGAEWQKRVGSPEMRENITYTR
jgi:heat shock protein HtpX